MANKYWVGNGGNWNDTNHWSLTSGGASGAGAPSSADNAYFDANSFSSGSQTVTVNITLSCTDMDWTGVTDTPTFASSNKFLYIYGSFTLVSGMTVSSNFSRNIYFKATTTGKTITFAGNHSSFNCGFWFDGAGGGWTLQDEMYTSSASGRNITLTRGSLDTNNQTITTGGFNSSNTNTRSLTLGSSTISCGRGFYISSTTGLTFDVGTSTINISDYDFDGGGLTYNDVNFTAAATEVIIGENTFSDLTVTGGTHTGASIYIADDQVVTGTFTINANSELNRVLCASVVDTDAVFSSTVRTITAGATSFDYVDFQYITAAGVSSPWSGTLLGDCTGNTDITFRTPDDYYWIGDAGNWADGANWSLSSGGGAASLYPLASDNAYFDANSFSSGSQTVTANIRRICNDLDFTGVTDTPTFSSSSANARGNVTFVSGMALSATFSLVFENMTGTSTLTSGTHTIYGFSCIGKGTVQLADDASIGIAQFSFIQGTFDANDYNISFASTFSSGNSNSRTILMGSGNWTFTGPNNTWNTSISTNLVLTPETSTVIINDTSATLKYFYGGGLTFNNLLFTGVGTGLLRFSNSDVTFNTLTIDTQPKTVQVTLGETITVTNLVATGSAGNLITLTSQYSGEAWNIVGAGGTISNDYLSIKDSQASGAIWLAGDNSVNVSNNTGWIFSSVGPTYNGAFFQLF